MKLSEPHTVRLMDLAYARSGDKGSSATLAVFARSPEVYPILESLLTEERLLQYFGKMGCVGVKRYELPKLEALSFFLVDILAGGGSRSLRIDAQGKTLAQAALLMELDLSQS